MLECSVSEQFGLMWVNATGRIDGLTSPQLHRSLSELILRGVRIIVVNVEGVNYISSAGLRVFLQVQKELKKVEGEIILYGAAHQVAQVFDTTGMSRHFCSVSTLEEIKSKAAALSDEGSMTSTQVGNIAFKCVQKHVETGTFTAIGSQEPLASSGYTEGDVVDVKPGEIRFGAGLACLGDDYEEYKGLFGEAMLVEHSLFFYPAVKRSAVDFMHFSDQLQGCGYKFLHGFGFNGPFKYLLSFEGAGSFVQLSELISGVFEIIDADNLGIVILAESKGLWAMNLKKAPIVENKPENGKDIFHSENFAEWMEFPIDPSDFNHIILAAGIAARNRESADARIRAALPEGRDFHLHAGVFSKGPLSRNAEHFESELKRVSSELEIFKIQHILGRSVFAGGTMGIVEIRG
ncbi:MAG: STAS domain-containing protein [Syntrophobacteraceae bacterium]